jgi:hypothetical protein
MTAAIHGESNGQACKIHLIQRPCASLRRRPPSFFRRRCSFGAAPLLYFRPTPATLPVPLRIRIIHALSHYFALQQPLHPSPQNRRRVPALPFSTVSLSSPHKTACTTSCSRAPAVIDCMRSVNTESAGNGDGYGERNCWQC